VLREDSGAGGKASAVTFLPRGGGNLHGFDSPAPLSSIFGTEGEDLRPLSHSVLAVHIAGVFFAMAGA
jgi:hypothetical protein